MIAILWKVVQYVSVYEALRAIFGSLIRAEIAKIAAIKTACRRCQWRIFCTKAAYFLFSHSKNIANVRIRGSLVLIPVAIGNGDAIWVLLQKLLEERKKVIENVRRQKEGVVSRLQDRKRS